MNISRKRKILVSSFITILFSIVTFTIGTFAWFSDSVSSLENIITVGNLDIEMYWTSDLNSDEWLNIENPEHNEVFSHDNYEPGYTDVKYLKIVNAGSLAFRYDLSLLPLGEVGELAEVVDVYYLGNVNTNISSNELGNMNKKGTIKNVLNNTLSGEKVLLPQNSTNTELPVHEVVVAVALQMQKNAGNEYQGKSIGDGFSIRLMATQYDYEEDSFGSDYDKGATFPVTATVGITTTDNKVNQETSINTELVEAVIPAGVEVKAGTTSLTLSVSELENTQSNIKLGNDESLTSLDVHIEGVSEKNTVPMLITINKVADKYLNQGNIQLYHVEDGKTIEMKEVLSAAELDSHNEFYYNPSTGTLVVALASFSEVSVKQSTIKAWEGGVNFDWYNTTSTTFTIHNADQLFGFSQIVGGMANGIEKDSFNGKTVKLIADINLGDDELNNNENVIFYPIGYYNDLKTYKRSEGTGKSIVSSVSSFRGTFDGNGHTISNFYQNTWEMLGDYNQDYPAGSNYYKDAMGLFGYVNGGTVKNLSIENFSSDGEFTPTGVVSAYAANATFENIAIRNCNPRVYNTGNGGIIGVAGNTDDKTENVTAETAAIQLKNITVDNSNKISALWGSWDVACGGLVGMYRGKGGIHFEDCHVSAVIDVNNDVCANYQYYAYRYAGMMIGSVRENVKGEDGRIYPNMEGIFATDCTVHYSTWNNYFYCELVENSSASYTHDYQMSRLTEIKELSEIQNSDGTWIKTGNFIIVKYKTDAKGNVLTDENGEDIVESSVCYHIRKDANGKLFEHKHSDSGIQTGVDENKDGVDDLKEDKQRIYLPFAQLVTGYSWGVTSKGLDDVDGVTEMDKVLIDSIDKFAVVLTENKFSAGTTIKLGDLFASNVDGGSSLDDIRQNNIQVGITYTDNYGKTLEVDAILDKENKSSWEEYIIQLPDGAAGIAYVTIQDYVYCTPTTVILNIGLADKFEVKLPERNFLYRVGNGNEISLGSLFKLGDGFKVTSTDVEIDVVSIIGVVSIKSYNVNSSAWNNSKIQLKGTGVITLTISEPTSLPKSIVLEVINANNITGPSSSTNGTDVVLLNDVTVASDGNANYTNCTVYGNGFTFYVTGGMNTYNSKQGHGIIIIKNATLDNLVVIGDVYDKYGAYTKDASGNLMEDYSAAIDATNSVIQNCYISNCSTPVRGDGVTIKDTTLYGGTVANLILSGNINTLENVTTVNYNDGRGVIGFGIVVSDGASDTTKLVLNGTLKQYNYVCSSDADSIPDDNAKKLFGKMFESNFTSYQYDVNGIKYVNTAILSMTESFNGSDITDNTNIGYKGQTVSYTTVNGYLYGIPNTVNYVDNNYDDSNDVHKSTIQGDYLPTPDFSLGTQMISKDSDDDTRYVIGDINGVEALYQDDQEPITLDLTKLMNIYKYDGDYYDDIKVSCKDPNGNLVSLNNGVATFNSNGTYKLIYTIKDEIIYDKNGELIEGKYVVRTYEIPLVLTIKEKGVEDAVISINSADISGEYVSSRTSKVYKFYPLKAIESIKDAGVDFNYKTNIMSTSISYGASNAFDGATTITITYNTGQILTVILGKPSGLNSPGASNGGKTISVITDNTEGIYIMSDGKIASSSAVAGTWPISGWSFKGINGSTITNSTSVNIKFTKPGCFAEGTMITLADGTQKPIEEITFEDELLVWNFFEGAYTSTVPSLIESHEKGLYRVINLKFADGTITRVIVDHGFFDVELNEFVYIDEGNVDSYIGHDFVKVSNNGLYEAVELIGYEITEEEVSYYTIQTAVYNNCIAENMFTLTSPPDIIDNDEWFDYFEIGEGMKYDEVKMQEDIEKYGLYTYEEFAEYVTYEQFLAFNGPYLKVLVARGVVTKELIIELISIYVNK